MMVRVHLSQFDLAIISPNRQIDDAARCGGFYPAEEVRDCYGDVAALIGVTTTATQQAKQRIA